MLLGIVAGGLPGAAAAQQVDTELVLLVDAAASGLNPSDFSEVMEGYASAMTSSQVLDSIESGALGRIAVSMILYGSDTVQQVAIPWMMVGSAAEAQQFAALARAVDRPSSGTSSLATGIDAAVASFGTETGGPDNGFISEAQIIEVGGTTLPRGGNPIVLAAELQAARDAALAAGADVINAMTIGRRASSLEGYYASNVIGGEVGGMAADTSSSTVSAALPAILASHLVNGLQGGATASLAAVPEPHVAMMLLLLVGVQALRRRTRF
jgi:hypothetical protein